MEVSLMTTEFKKLNPLERQKLILLARKRWRIALSNLDMKYTRSPTTENLEHSEISHEILVR